MRGTKYSFQRLCSREAWRMINRRTPDESSRIEVNLSFDKFRNNEY